LWHELLTARRTSDHLDSETAWKPDGFGDVVGEDIGQQPVEVNVTVAVNARRSGFCGSAEMVTIVVLSWA
jgi:hypothetical protein